MNHCHYYWRVRTLAWKFVRVVEAPDDFHQQDFVLAALSQLRGLGQSVFRARTWRAYPSSAEGAGFLEA